MKEETDSLSFEEEIVDESSSLCDEDFNSEDAFCEELSGGEGPSEIEILGMELLLRDEEEVTSDFLDDSENDSNEISDVLWAKRTVDSLELARKRLPHLVCSDCKQATKRRKPRKLYSSCNPGGEVDSLILARERLPGLVHIDEREARLMKFYEEGRGLMGEVDSLVLDRQRLPHLVHERSTPEKRRKPRVTKQAYCELLSDMEYYVKLAGDSDTSTTESESSSDTLFTSGTVDSLILTRKRLASHQHQDPPGRPFDDAEDIQTWSSGESFERQLPAVKPKLPPKPGVGLGMGLQRTSSGARAA